mmetsp:Transcript_25594/g.43733  ORF Transcript_25594/g.43733 Transcript_25594/m.43733 type:complete len:151 (-) Transcript_25594:183-635(-)
MKLVPRGAVAVVCFCVRTSRLALVARATEPNRGTWSLPGGKIELGESTMAAAARELREETGIADATFAAAPFTVTDVVEPKGCGSRFHYLIAQTFAAVDSSDELLAGDDAAAARWFSLEQLDEMCETRQTTPAVVGVVRRAMQLREHGLL